MAVGLDEAIGPELAAVVMQNALPDCGLPLCPKLLPKPAKADESFQVKQPQQRRNTTSGNIGRSVRMPGIES